jgi:cysteine desulfurase
VLVESYRERVEPLRARLEDGLRERAAKIFGDAVARVPNTTYFAFPDVEGETLVIQLDAGGFATASGAACSSHHTGPSHVLLAMGVDEATAGRAVRVSLGRGNDEAQVDDFLAKLDTVLGQLTSMAAIAA